MAILTYTNNTGIAFADLVTSTQTLSIFGLGGQAITDVSVSLTGISHTFMGDLDVLLVGPNGVNNLMFLSDAGGGGDLIDANLTFSDSATELLGSSGPNTVDSGDYRPAAHSAGENDATFGSATGGINSAAPNGASTFASAFGGFDSSGTWQLYIRDDAGADTGSLDSWSVTVSTANNFVALAGGGGAEFYSLAPGSATSGEFSVNGGDAVLYAGVSFFTIDAAGGNDVVFGSAGGDQLTGGSGRDQLYGVGGDDIFHVHISHAVAGEIYDGGGGNDTLFVSGGSFVHDLRALTIRSIETLRFDDPGVFATGTVRLNAAQFGAGLSLTGTIDGDHHGDVTDLLEITMGSVSSLNLSGLTMQEFNSVGDRVLVIGDGSAETIIGTTARDELRGNGGADVLNGGAGGSDALLGGIGNDRLLLSHSIAGQVDELNGEGDIDTADFSGFTSAIWVDLDFAGVQAQTRDTNTVTSGTWRDVAYVLNTENLVGTAFSDQLLGSALDNVFSYTGNVGNVADIYNGRGGADTADFSGFNHAVWVDLAFAGVEAQTRDTANTTSGTWRSIADLANIENVADTAFSDQLLGNDLANVFSYTGNVGNVVDIYNGRGGVDTADFSRFGSAVWVDLNFVGTEAQTRDGANVTSGTWRNIVDLTGFENITGTAQSDSLSGNTLANRITGGRGDDALRGRGGNDVFVFSAGFGQDTVMDWQDTGSGFEDVIDLGGMGLAFGSLGIVYGANAVITIGTDTITLTGVTSGLDAGDFNFA